MRVHNSPSLSRNLAELAAQLGVIAKAISAHPDFNAGARLRVPFPRGYIRPIRETKKRWPYVDDAIARTLACTIQLVDVARWHLNVWDVGLTAGTEWEGHSTVPIVCVIETLLCQFALLNAFIDRENLKFALATDLLRKRGVYDHAFGERLHALRRFRNELHLREKDRVAAHDGSVTRYNAACLVLGELEEYLRAFPPAAAL